MSEGNTQLLDYVKPNGTPIQINPDSVSFAESLGWKPADAAKPKAKAKAKAKRKAKPKAKAE